MPASPALTVTSFKPAMITCMRDFLLRGLALLLALAAFPGEAVQDDRIHVVVSMVSQKYFVQRVAGELARVSVLVGPGQSPATYEPTPRQMAGLAGASLFYRIGVPFEQVRFDRLLAVNPSIPALDALDLLVLASVVLFYWRFPSTRSSPACVACR